MQLNYIRKLLDTLLFSNVFIACCAVAQGLLTYRLLGIPVNQSILVILGCATLALYNFSMILARPRHPGRSPYRRVRWVFRHERSLWGWTAAALVVLLLLGFRLHLPSFLLLGIMGMLGLAYNLPFIRIAGAERSAGLRQITGVKLFYIGAMWAMSAVLLPVAEAYHDGFPTNWPGVLQLMAWVFLFVVAITIPFDVRDIYQDRHYGLKTIPILVGERKALALSGGLLLLHAGWVWFSGYPLTVRLSLVATSVLCLLVIWFPPVKKNEYYYFLLLDGMMLLQWLAVYGCSALRFL
ncbi:UbiA prenyltransferase family protein [Parapedobacter composti]|uniref:UbiA prenyltransferase family protein n=1 Tax=Parapedobacter composti TaxID=623281 RepID=A0A1I1EYS1_9SPHI|nr:UbiA family prenyltransferase [Parapedobacter composti]SFB92127.1 UbiA prenyltransferase family protein [Parapedobacter composti]